MGYDDRKNHRYWLENEVSGIGLERVIRTFSNEMRKGFLQAMEWMRSFLSEIGTAEIADYFISGRDG